MIDSEECGGKCDCENCVRSNNAKKAIDYLVRRGKRSLAEAVYVAAQDAEKYHKLCLSFANGEVESFTPFSDGPDTLQ